MLGPNEPSPQAHHPTPIVVAHMMTPGVVQVPGDVSVSEAALLLEREHAPCLLVKETEHGLWTDDPSRHCEKGRGPGPGTA